MSDSKTTEKLPSLDISQMIASENDPKQRASLMVLHAISTSLEAITVTIRDMQDKFEIHLLRFETHATKEQELMNQGKGAWKIMAGLIGFAQVFVIFIGNEVRTDLSSLRSSSQAAVVADMKLESRINMLESKLVVLEGKKP